MSNAQTAAAVAALALVGVVAWRELDKKVEAAKGGAAVTGTQGTGTPAAGGLLTGLLRPGSTGSHSPVSGVSSDAAAVIRNQQETAAATLKQNRIDILRRDLADTWNALDLEVVKANAIKARQPDASFTGPVADREWASCRNSGAWLTQAQRCNNSNMGPRIDAAIKKEWGEKVALELTPIQARLSELDARQLALIANLRELGYPVPQQQVRQVTK